MKFLVCTVGAKKVSVHYLRYVISTIKASFARSYLFRTMQPWQHRTFCALSTYPFSYLYCVPRTSYAVASLILALVGINSTYTRPAFIRWSKGPLYCCIFSSISLSVCVKLNICNVVDVLARSSISRSLCGPLSPSCN